METQKRAKNDIVVGSVCYGVEIIEKLPLRRSKVVCRCGNSYVTDNRNLRRNSINNCPTCRRKRNTKLLEVAALKRKKWTPPENRLCKSCNITKPYGDFPPKRHTCKICSNVGRSAYYYNNTEEKDG